MDKAYGFEIVEFFTKGFPSGFYVDDSEFLVSHEGKILKEDDETETALDLYEMYDLDRFGTLFCDTNPHDDHDTRSLSTEFHRWKKEQSTVTLLVSVPKAEAEEAKSFIRALGYKIEG